MVPGRAEEVDEFFGGLSADGDLAVVGFYFFGLDVADGPGFFGGVGRIFGAGEELVGAGGGVIGDGGGHEDGVVFVFGEAGG